MFRFFNFTSITTELQLSKRKSKTQKSTFRAS